MKTPRCEDCNGACCKTLWIPTQIGRAWKDREWLSTRAPRKVWSGPDLFNVLDATCPELADSRCSIYPSRPQTCRDLEVGGAMCLASIRLSNRWYWDELQEDP